MRKISLFLLLTIFLALLPAQNARAQDATPPGGPVYIIQPGDSLSGIAARFNIALGDLMNANGIANANDISAGARLVIPGLQGVSGVLNTTILDYGETLANISRRYQISESLLRKLNRVTSPAELYAGVSLVIPEEENTQPLSRRLELAPGESLLESAMLAGSDPYTLTALNGLSGAWSALPGEVYYAPGSASQGAPAANGMPSAFASVKINALPLTQGHTAEITVSTQPGVTLSGMLVDKPLHFAPLEGGNFVALQGVHAMLEPGPYPLQLQASLPDGSQQSFEQMILVQSGNYPNDPILLVEPSTIDPVTTEAELKQIEAITAPFNATRFWDGIFQSPAYFNDCFTSRYGNRREYIGQGTEQKYYSFHTGLDFCGGEGLPITAPADGVIVFAGPLTIRGNAVIIDHGWGVYSGFWHQPDIEVQVGQSVKKGELIGKVGGTGRVTGAHLHWEVWVNGVQVDPFDWLDAAYP
ncbi:MAG: hypothetical protein OHK0031_08670 [Anaerolineales bacterium]